MAINSNILKIVTLLIFVAFFNIILMNIFNDGHSYFYGKIWNRMKDNKPSFGFLNSEKSLLLNVEDKASLLNDDTFSEYTNQEPSDDDLMRLFELTLTNVPFAYWQRHKDLNMQKSKNCALFPKLTTIEYYNNYWQTYRVRNITMQLYAAYYDERSDVQPGPVVRILAMINQLKGTLPPSYCHLWYENEEKPEIVPVLDYRPIWQFWGTKMFFPYMISCRTSGTSDSKRIPRAVALVEKPCYVSTNILNVIYNKPKTMADKHDFAICVKGLDFPYADISSRLAEWLELHRVMGVHKVFIYDIALHANVRKVLAHYQKEGFVDLKPITLVGGMNALPLIQHWLLRDTKLNKQLNELIPYNDCFYSNMYLYNYIAVVDVDEVIMPLGRLNTWYDILKASRPYQLFRNCSQGFSGLCFRNTYYPFDSSNFTLLTSRDNQINGVTKSKTPDYMFMLKHQYRTSNYSQRGYATKCLHRTSKTLTLHNHYAVEWMNSCRPFDVPETLAHLQHYHDIKSDEKFNAVIGDFTVERYREELIERVTRVLQQVGLIK